MKQGEKLLSQRSYHSETDIDELHGQAQPERRGPFSSQLNMLAVGIDVGREHSDEQEGQAQASRASGRGKEQSETAASRKSGI